MGCSQKLKWQANTDKRMYVSWFFTMDALWIYYVEIDFVHVFGIGCQVSTMLVS